MNQGIDMGIRCPNHWAITKKNTHTHTHTMSYLGGLLFRSYTSVDTKSGFHQLGVRAFGLQGAFNTTVENKS